MAASVEGREVTATIIIDCQLDSEDVQPSGRSPATRSTKWKHVSTPFLASISRCPSANVA